MDYIAVRPRRSIHGYWRWGGVSKCAEGESVLSCGFLGVGSELWVPSFGFRVVFCFYDYVMSPATAFSQRACAARANSPAFSCATFGSHPVFMRRLFCSARPWSVHVFVLGKLLLRKCEDIVVDHIVNGWNLFGNTSASLDTATWQTYI